MYKLLSVLLIILVCQASAGIFDERYPSARATAMSGSIVSLAHDVWAPYYNPAGLANVQNSAVGVSYQSPYNLSFFHNYFLSAVTPVPYGNFGTVALSFQKFGVSYQDNDMSAEYTFGLSHGFTLMKDIHSSLGFGYNLKYYHWSLGESVSGLELGAGSSFGVDVGLQGSIYSRTFIGLYFLNINTPNIGAINKHELPQRIVAGLGYTPIDNMATTLAINKTIGKETQVEAGFEFYIIQMLAIRLGVSTSPNRFSGGLGFNYENIHFDYALRTHPVLSETHQFGLSYYID
jgi:hypothetical protein